MGDPLFTPEIKSLEFEGHNYFVKVWTCKQWDGYLAAGNDQDLLPRMFAESVCDESGRLEYPLEQAKEIPFARLKRFIVEAQKAQGMVVDDQKKS